MKLATITTGAAAVLRSWIWDLVAVLGLALIAGGLWTIYPPAGLIACGIILALIGIAGAKKWDSSQHSLEPVQKTPPPT